MNKTKAFRLICAAGLAAATALAGTGVYAAPAMSKAPSAARQTYRIQVKEPTSQQKYENDRCFRVRSGCQQRYWTGSAAYAQCVYQQRCVPLR
jgi:hypothetical protein